MSLDGAADGAGFRCHIVIAVLFLAAFATKAAVAMKSPSGTWLGQDGHDYCQTERSLGANDIQDLHIRLEGLNPADAIEGILVRRAGGGEWAAGHAGGPWTWKARLIRADRSPTADLFMEPSHAESWFQIDADLKYASGEIAHFSVPCGRSNPNSFMPEANLAARWIGQDGHDWTGRSAAVGPDGFQDAAVEITGVSTRLEVKSIAIYSGARMWEYGLNPERRWNAEFIRDPRDRSRGTLFFSPERDLKGERLRLQIVYSIMRSNMTELAAGPSDPTRRMPTPRPIQITSGSLKVVWRGQEDATPTNRGDVHLSISGYPKDRKLVGAALSDMAGGFWIHRRSSDIKMHPAPGSDMVPCLPMALRERADSIDLLFPPYRDETNTPMLLRLVWDDDSFTARRFIGGSCDPFLRGALPATRSVTANPGDDLNAIGQQFGRIELSPGEHVLTHPLKLNRPITITGGRAAVLSFKQTAIESAWSGAILIGAGNTTLEGFTIRFSDNFRWATRGPGGASLIRTINAENRDPKANISLLRLDVESPSIPPPANPKDAVEAPYLVRFAEATSGRIVGNRFRGGTVDVNNGPWEIRDNEHHGTPPGTVAWDAFGGHWLHDFTLERNRVFADGLSGKIWRFISMNQLGQRVSIRSNDVAGVGMRDNDEIPNPNAPEILLTESYRLYYEGMPAAIESGGQVLQIPMVMYGAVRAGSIVSILSGPNAGTYRAIAQPLTPTAFLMQDPLPSGNYAISIAHGYVDSVIERNRIDVRGGKSAAIVLAGNHWGVSILNNHVLGGGDSMLLQSTPTENPSIWGWSHTPFMGFNVEGNIIELSLRGVSIDAHSDRHNKTSEGRTYMSGVFRDNLARGWQGGDTQPFRLGSRSDSKSGPLHVDLRHNTSER